MAVMQIPLQYCKSCCNTVNPKELKNMQSCVVHGIHQHLLVPSHVPAPGRGSQCCAQPRSERGGGTELCCGAARGPPGAGEQGLQQSQPGQLEMQRQMGNFRHCRAMSCTQHLPH